MPGLNASSKYELKIYFYQQKRLENESCTSVSKSFSVYYKKWQLTIPKLTATPLFL